MPLFLCRWPNGDCSIVAARDREAAIDLLDNEVGDAESLPLYRLAGDFLVNPELRNDGRFELDGDQPFSSDLASEILRRVYPLLDAALQETGSASENTARRKIAEAVKEEKGRVTNRKVRAATPTGRRLREIANVPANKADRIAWEAARKKLQ